MRIPSGVTDQVIFFVAVDSTDLKTRETGLGSFTVYRARDTGAATVMTTPTVAELSAANMPGVYSLLLDEDMTIASGNDSEEMVFHITQASMAPVTRTIELYRPKITAGETLTVSSGAVGSVSGLTASDVGAIKTKTDNLPTDPADESLLEAAIAGVQSDTDNIQTRLPAALVSGRMDASVGAMAANVMTAAAAAADLTTELQTGLATAAALATVQADTDDLQTRIPAVLVSGRIDASVGAMAANVVTAAAAAADLTTELQAGLATAAALATVQSDTDDIQTRLPAALVGGRIDASVGVVALDAIDAVALKADAGTELADALLDRATAIEGYTPRQLLRLFAAVLVGKASGLDTATAVYRDVADTKDRVTATVTADGNRSAVTLDAN